MGTEISNDESSRNENSKNSDDDNDIIYVVVVIESKDYYFRPLSQKIKLNNVRTMLLKDETAIRPSDEPKLSLLELLEVVEKKYGNHYLYINQNAEFDLTQLRFEKGFKINKDNSVISASHQAFEITHDGIQIEKKNEQNKGTHECKHEKTTECKRSFMFDVKLSAASEWVSACIGLSQENSNKTLKKHTIHTRHSYELVLIENSKSKAINPQVGAGIATIFKPKINAIQSLNNAKKWKITGYENIYSLFELSDDELKEKALNIMGHQILETKFNEIKFNIKEYEKNKKPCGLYVWKKTPVIVIHHIQGDKAKRMPKNINIRIGWMFIEPPTSFEFKTTNNTPQVKNSSDKGMATCIHVYHNPYESTFTIGNYLTRCQESVRQESAQLFVYDIKAEKEVTDEEVLK
ncbi:1084_t:CDS:2 [Cetraspora pellucida]|uniref:1084_t:CDS:1 n=1 Tax=Cetraspora pellucida TaxID=1433469 RepID=A0A9N9GDI8_9GLOM|nr:1084_t:CDS:2 [Cetraspora pellucida]